MKVEEDRMTVAMIDMKMCNLSKNLIQDKSKFKIAHPTRA